jgi:deazaflavin-dependent oxidoreductase (nitroreductase family)
MPCRIPQNVPVVGRGSVLKSQTCAPSGRKMPALTGSECRRAYERPLVVIRGILGSRRFALRIAQDAGVAEMSHTRERLRRFLIRAMSRAHGGVYRASGGRLLGRVAGMPVLLLTTTGRESGKPRTAALTYVRDGADLVVIGSFGGSDLPPAWWLNLQRDPWASVLIGGTTSKVIARAATAKERDRLWPVVTTTHPGYARYQERTARLIPIVMLTPRTE